MAGTVLIIDDSRPVREEIARILSNEGGDFDRVLQAEDGLAGIKLLKEMGGGVDVVVCDVNMPLLDGYKVVSTIRADPRFRDLPIVMVTAEREVEDLVRAFDLGAYDFIAKPFIPAVLKARLRSMLRIKQLSDRLKTQNDLLERIATTDPLTGIPNRRHFHDWLAAEIERNHRYRTPFSVIMLDLDHFKDVNDTFGHPMGDAVLREIGALLQEVMRKVDMVARYGGEEFVMGLPQTDCAGSMLAAERLRARVEKYPFPGFPPGFCITISLGVACLPFDKTMSPDDLVAAADQALYKAKKAGRNRVELAPAP